ncbi:MAG: hypothetical protein ABL921_11725 [Pirellula sp.]
MFEKRARQAEALSSIFERLVGLGVDRLELQDAVKLGTAALECLERARAELLSAEDVWPSEELGGVFDATKAQLTRIDKAGQYSRDAQRLLRKLREELSDATLGAYIDFHIKEFSTFVESFMDGMISDWVVKSKIQAASSTCGITIAAVSATLVECQRQLDEVDRNIKTLTERRRQFIESGECDWDCIPVASPNRLGNVRSS